MSTLSFRKFLLLMCLPIVGCSIYDEYGYGRVVESKLDEPTVVVLPEHAMTISQRYRPVPGPASQEHRGFDILAPSETPVLAAADGVVTSIPLSFLYGRQVMVDHGYTREGYRIQTRYFHLSERWVEPGQKVSRGEALGASGVSGMAGGYPHLHFEVHRLNEATPAVAIGDIDPQLFWVDGVGQVTCYDAGREYLREPVKLTYPVPCLGVEWQ